jgi:hypothetical protein
LIIPLAETPPITSTSDYVFRYDFPSITTYTNGFHTANSSTTQIPDTGKGIQEDGIINTFDAEVNITGDLNVNGGVEIDTGEYFDTIVIRRPTGETGRTDDYRIALRELQVWVNGSNLLVANQGSLSSYFALWDTNKDAEVDFTSEAFNIYNNIIEDIDTTAGAAVSAPSNVNNTDNALVIKNIPLTFINSIQALVLYNRVVSETGDRAIGVAI